MTHTHTHTHTLTSLHWWGVIAGRWRLGVAAGGRRLVACHSLLLVGGCLVANVGGQLLLLARLRTGQGLHLREMLQHLFLVLTVGDLWRDHITTQQCQRLCTVTEYGVCIPTDIRLLRRLFL